MQYIRRFDELGISDIPVVGGKNASLGEMVRALATKGVSIPNGFATTAEAYRLYLEHNGLTERIRSLLSTLDISDVTELAAAGAKIRNWLLHGELPPVLAEELRSAYRELEQAYGDNPDVAVRSSATAEDLPDASFAGQQETYLNIRGSQNLLSTCKQVFASLFTDRAISYRADKGFDHMSVALSIGVQKMVRADLACSGVMFTIDTETGFRDAVFITGAYGLGENVVQGAVNPDEFYVFKPTLEHYRPILRRHLGSKAIRMIYGQGSQATYNVEVPAALRQQFCLSDDEVLQLARQAVIIEQHYGRPMDIEWAKDGENGDLYIVQARPETVEAQKSATQHDVYHLKQRSDIITQGKSVGQKVANGQARVILQAADMRQLQPGEILVTDITDPDWEPVMKIAAGIITNRGGRTCHAAIVARELGIPAIVGCGNATQAIHSGDPVTLSCAEGDIGYVYQGLLAFDVAHTDLSTLAKPRTHIMLNLADPDQAFALSRLPVDGVGLARMEFIINNSIRVHPRALLEFESLSRELRAQITPLIAGYANPTDYYIQRLAEGIGTIAAAFYPRPVIVRMSDFKSNEYAALLGGCQYEPVEENPMIGFRGASRYPSPAFAECFALECAALRQVRKAMGLNNLEAMIPFVRSVDEATKVLDIMASHGLVRGQDGLKIHLMCEIPANALLADDFLAHFDGFSIGSNDLTQLTLGVDRDSGLVTGVDERNPAVLKLMELAIAACQRQQKYIGICGQAPSDYPEITQWLVNQGIGSISLNADSVLPMTQVVLDAEAHGEGNK